MAQLTVYMEETILRKVEVAAKREHESVSKWVKKHLVSALQTTWPSHYFDLFGSLTKEKLERPPQPDFSSDSRRQRL